MRYLFRSLLCVSLSFCIVFLSSYSALASTTTEQVYNYDSFENETDSPVLFSINDSQIVSGYLNVSSRLYNKVGSTYYTIFNTNIPQYTPPFNYSTGTQPYTSSQGSIWRNTNDVIEANLIFTLSSGADIFDKGDVVSIDLNGLYYAYHTNYTWSIVNYGGGTANYFEPFDLSDITHAYLAFVSSDGSKSWVTITDNIKVNDDTFGFNVKDVEVPFDTKELYLQFNFTGSADDLDSNEANSGFQSWGQTGLYEFRFIDSTLIVEYEDGSIGLLNGIIDWLRNIRDGITSVGQGVTNVVSSITQLPTKMQDMLIGFFVPDEDTINSKYAEFETLLSERFGLIYQSSDIIHDFAESFQTQAVMTADTGGIITMPQVTVLLAGSPFTFGGYEVDVIPNGFETLQQMCRLAVSMVCTVVFINMLKTKLEWILR